MIKIEKTVKNNPLFFAFLFPALVDVFITLVGQRPDYWNKKLVNDASPAYYFLRISPWLFLIGSVIWFIAWYWIFKRLKEPFNLWLMFIFIAGHSWGSSSWIMNLLKRNGVYTLGNQVSIIFAWSLLIIYFILIGASAAYCLKISDRNQSQTPDSS